MMMQIKTMRRGAGLLFILLIAGALGSCSATPSLPASTAALPLPAAWGPESIQRTLTVSWTLPESIVVSEQSGSACSVRSLSTVGIPQWDRPLPFCPERASVVAGGLVLFQTSAQALLVGRDGSSSSDSAQIVAAATGSLVLRRTHDLLEVAGTDIHMAERGVKAAGIADRNGRPTVVAAIEDERGGETLVREPGHLVLTPAFARIDSFDLSSDGREVVFSARRETGGFDTGLVSTDGGEIHWLPNDPSDEVAVLWAPVGYKAGYLIRRADGDLFRSIHIPTSVQMIVDLPLAAAGSWSWSPDGTRIAVVSSSPDRGDHVDLVSVDGVVRRELAAPRRRAELNVESLDGFAGTILTRPAAMRYNETVPLVVWTSEREPLRWDDARGRLADSVRTASVVTSGSAGDLGPDFWRRIKSIGWIDPSRIYVVGAGPRSAALPDQATLIAAVPGERGSPGYREERMGMAETVLLTAPSPADVKSFAASYIANRLKGTSPPNDHR
jgi:dipeptidyl aminopeptidase/acylaminoacyl peptidase